MTRFTAFLIGFAIVIVGFASCQRANSQTVYNVQHDGTPQFCATTVAVSGSNYNFTGTCAVTPPPVDPVDPLGMNTIVGRYADHACSTLSTANGQDFGAVFFGTAYPYRPQTSAFFTIPSGKRYSAVMHMPQNPGTERHFLKADAYGGSCSPPLNTNPAVFDWQMIAADSVTLPPTGKCSGSSFAGDRGSIFTVNPSNGIATDNPTMCNARFGHSYRVIVDPRITTPQALILTWY